MKDVNEFIETIIGNSGRGGVDSGGLTPLSIPGTPSLRREATLPLPISGRNSRQSDFTSEGIPSLGTTLTQSTSSATDAVLER